MAMKYSPRPPPRNTLLRIVRAFTYAAQGCRVLWREEFAFRIEIIVFALAALTALWAGGSAAEKALLIAVCALVPVVETLNSALEAVVDRISMEEHPLSRRAKDLGACAVGLSIALAVIVWATVLLLRWF